MESAIRLSASQFRASPYAKNAKPRRYRNQPIVTDEGRFDSLKEHARWQELKLLQKGGAISDLERQARVPLIVNGHDCGDYVADARYRDHASNLILEDTKSPVTRKDPVYRLKKRLVLAIHGLEIREI